MNGTVDVRHTGRPRRVSLRSAALVLALSAAYWLMAMASARGSSLTPDELPHLAGGYGIWLAGDFRLFPENGVLPQAWAALPLWLEGYRFPSFDHPAWLTPHAYSIGWDLVYELGNDTDRLILEARSMIALFGVALGVLIYFWTRHLFGPSGGAIALFVFVFDPGMLTHGGLVTSDMAAALFFTASAWSLWELVHRPRLATILASGFAVAGLFLSKMSAVLVLPMALLMTFVRLLASGRDRPRGLTGVTGGLLCCGILAWALVWGAYGFRYAPAAEDAGGTFAYEWEALLDYGGRLRAVLEAGRERRLLPDAYLYGFTHMLAHSSHHPTFLNGQYSWTGWWYFFPYCLLVKTPLSLFAILLLAAAAGVTAPPGARRGTVGAGLYRTAPLWILLAVYWAAALTTSLNIGHRHILPTYPAMFVLAGAASFWLREPRRMPRMLVASLLALLAVDSLAIRPHYLAFFNGLVGGPAHAHRHLVDSSLDWGQDLRRLKRWLDDRDLDETRVPIYLSYFGAGNPDAYGIGARRLPGYPERRRTTDFRPLTGGLYCVSATMLRSLLIHAQGPWAVPYERLYQELWREADRFFESPAAQAGLLAEHGREYWDRRFGALEELRFARLCAFLRQREPDHSVGHSILIYFLSDEDVRQALFGPPAELEPDVRVEARPEWASPFALLSPPASVHPDD